MQKEYYTLLSSGMGRLEEKKSIFLAHAIPVSNEAEAVQWIDAKKTEYWDAKHNVYAYCIGGEFAAQRFSDDGEPSGTAGLPVIEVIKRMNLQDLAIVITRYFGGTLLGAAGLIRAYGKSAALAIEAAGVVQKKLCTEVKVTTPYPLVGKLQNLFLTGGYWIKDTAFGQDVEFSVLIPVESVGLFSTRMEEATNARAIVELGDKAYVTLDKENKRIVPPKE